MTRTFSTIILAVLAALFLFVAVQPHRVEAAAQAPAQAAPPSAANVQWPPPQEPLETTPITPVESAGAPMYESF
jgi:hypothetical protein